MTLKYNVTHIELSLTPFSESVNEESRQICASYHDLTN
jgi:hypothetical protein